MKKLLLPIVLIGCLCQAASAVTILFDTNADYDTNFWEAGAVNTSGLSRVAGGYLEKTGTTSVAFYSPGATGGSGGSGGTTEGTTPVFGVGDRIRTNFSTSHLDGGNSFGFYTGISTNETSGYAVIFRITSATTADFRVFDTATDPSAAGAAGQFGGTLNFTTSGAFTANTFYTFQLDLVQNGANLNFVASMYDATTQAQIGVTQTITDSTAPVFSGGVALRLNASATVTSPNVRADNFSIEAIPEPSGGVLFTLASLSLAIIRRRK